MSPNFCFAFICGKSIKTEKCFHQKFNFIIALVLSLNLSVFSKKFCTAFRENGHKISYAFQTKNDRVAIVINGQYWRLNIKRMSYHGIMYYTLNLWNIQSKECALFSAEYSAVFVDYHFKENMAFLFNVTIIW